MRNLPGARACPMSVGLVALLGACPHTAATKPTVIGQTPKSPMSEGHHNSSRVFGGSPFCALSFGRSSQAKASSSCGSPYWPAGLRAGIRQPRRQLQPQQAQKRARSHKSNSSSSVGPPQANLWQRSQSKEEEQGGAEDELALELQTSSIKTQSKLRTSPTSSLCACLRRACRRRRRPRLLSRRRTHGDQRWPPPRCRWSCGPERWPRRRRHHQLPATQNRCQEQHPQSRPCPHHPQQPQPQPQLHNDAGGSAPPGLPSATTLQFLRTCCGRKLSRGRL